MLKPLLFSALLLSVSANAQTPTTEQQAHNPLESLGNEFQNSIKLLQNRFRIDHEVEEITMVFFRDYGSLPVVLVRPDGSKIYQSQADGESIFWFDTATYDMVSIKKPVPGPWQAIGSITPDSRVMVISDLTLHAEPLPNIIFSGEILKQTAYLTNGGEPINYSEFRDVVTLNMQFFSTNNPDYNNFGADSQTIATFEDNGQGMDEKPLDGTFTGQFNLSVASGEWIPTFIVSTPMFSREQVGEPVMLYPNPIHISVERHGGGGGYHKLIIDAEREHIDMSSLLIDGKVQFPNGDIQNFSITDMTPDVREHLIVNYEYGVYRIKLTAFGNTLDGRDLILDVPEFSFLTEEPIVAPEIDDNAIAASTMQASEQLNAQGMLSAPLLGQDVAPEMAIGTLVSLIIGINVFLLMVGGTLIWFMTKEKPATVDELLKEKVPVKGKEVTKLGLIASLKSRLSRNKDQKSTKADKASKGKKSKAASDSSDDKA
ncbi:MAG: TIGR03503 family protein [Paraglaciecola polaris]|uniref:TIGR03503 family protein n=1 Tax=Paraglaciecola polaris TaxID=222814 RepID=UPI0030031545|tara:strand:- start:182 stop:1639 length:1458 start_codon:yes stop_codon:yes gene_type:complete